MPEFLKQIRIVLVLVLLDFCGSLAKKPLSIDNEPIMERPLLSHLNSSNLYYHPFMIFMKSCGGSCNIFDYPFKRTCVEF